MTPILRTPPDLKAIRSDFGAFPDVIDLCDAHEALIAALREWMTAEDAFVIEWAASQGTVSPEARADLTTARTKVWALLPPGPEPGKPPE